MISANAPRRRAWSACRRAFGLFEIQAQAFRDPAAVIGIGLEKNRAGCLGSIRGRVKGKDCRWSTGYLLWACRIEALLPSRPMIGIFRAA
ncbi:MAG: hypothetical protein DRH20_02970 [Deltaproteobacteria bacterium]|nr:MAG: hypothetical protein DRH20_02970 [Deltaproteobacteria bacterium]